MRKTFAILLLALLSLPSWADYDFYATAPSGQRLYYSFASGGRVTVTFPASSSQYAWYNYAKPTGALTIPDSVTYSGTTYAVTAIAGYAFKDCSGITAVSLPTTITSIPNYSFTNCTGLARVDYRGTLEQWCQIDFGYYDANPLDYAEHLYIDSAEVTHPVFPSTMTQIKQYAFTNCKGMTAVTLPASITLCGAGAFSSCDNLTRVDYTGTMADWCRIDFGTTSANPLNYAHHLYIDSQEVTSLVIPSSVTAIKKAAFCGGAFSQLTIPAAMDTIGGYAFSDCTSLDSIFCLGTVPPRLCNTAFYNSRTAAVMVPCGSWRTYHAHPEWSRFSNLFQPCNTAVITALSSDTACGTVTGGGEYELGTTVTLNALPRVGCLFNGWSDLNTSNPRTVTVVDSASYTALFALPVPDTVELHDTTLVEHLIHDTAYIEVPVHDTVILSEFIHDTVFIEILVHDTVIIHDTLYLDPQGVEIPTDEDFRVGTDRGMIILYGAPNRQVRILDARGRQLLVERNLSEAKHYRVPATGVYFLQVDSLPARKVVVKE